jgi:hypothetical protein
MHYNIINMIILKSLEAKGTFKSTSGFNTKMIETR